VVDAINGTPLDITETNMADVLSLAIAFGFVGLLGQGEARELGMYLMMKTIKGRQTLILVRHYLSQTGCGII
jgi:hypothetical protein